MISLFFLLANKFIYSQPLSPDTSKIKLNWILGYWQSVDTPGFEIQFIESKHEIILKLRSWPSYFFQIDSLEFICPSGCYPNWPPFDARLEKLNNDSLAIHFSQVGMLNRTNVYVKRLKK